MTRSLRGRAAACLPAAGFLFLAIAASAATFSDGTFNNADWTTQHLTVTGGQPSDPAATFTAGQFLTGGNPGAYHGTTHNYNGPNQGITLAHTNGSEVWNAAVSGAIANISVSFDVNFFNAPGTGPIPSAAVGYGAVLIQNGNFYLANGIAATLPSWTHFSISNLTASDFFLLNGSASPDFSSGGAPITFGFYSSNGTCCNAPTTTISGLDNWSVTVTSQVPVPAALPLFASGLGALAWLARRKKKHAA